MRLPSELMTPDQRDARMEEIPREISREWLRFALAEAVVLWLPFVGFLVAYVATDAIPESALVPVVVVGIAISAGLVGFWVLTRIRPLQRELEALEHSVASRGQFPP